VALPALGVVALVLMVRSPGVRRLPTTRESPVASRAAIHLDLQPTVFNYQMVANDSLDELDQLLTTQGNRNPPSAPQLPGPAWE
jgi:hypothetical protein